MNERRMEVLKYTRRRSPELAEYLEAVAASSFCFEGSDPLQHSSHNHVHLWKIEYLADSCNWIDVNYRVEAVSFLLEQWRRRLKGLAPYRQLGYRMYLYEDRAPTISVVAQTQIGFPYSYGTPIFVDHIRDILTLYEGRSWKQHFAEIAASEWEISTKRILSVVQKNGGSISRPTANQLGLPVGKLRTLIINMGLGDQINSIRKQFKRRPADFTKEFAFSDRWHVFERILQPHFR